MKSAILKQDHDDLMKLSRSLSPAERLVAFYNHSRLVTEFSSVRKGGSRKGPDTASAVPRSVKT